VPGNELALLLRSVPNRSQDWTLDGTLIVAAYAAVVSTASVLWQVLLWRADRQGRLTVELRAYWSQDDEKIEVSITNLNPYEVTLAGGRLSIDPSGGSFPLRLEYLKLPTAVPPRNAVQWVIDRGLISEKLPSASLAKATTVKVHVWTGVGRSESARAKVSDLDEWNRRTFTKAMWSLTSLNYGDTVRILDAENGVMSESSGRTGSIRGFDQVKATVQLRLDDHSWIDVPVTQLELVAPYASPRNSRS
jgi:hypothetical protein